MMNFTKCILKRGVWVLLLMAGVASRLGAQELLAFQANNQQPSKAAYTSADGITIRAENLSLAEVLRQVEKQSGYFFIYADEEVNAGGKINVDLQNKTIEGLLNELLAPLEIDYQMQGKQIVLQRKKNAPKAEQSHAQEMNGSATTNENSQTQSFSAPMAKPIVFLVKGKLNGFHSMIFLSVGVLFISTYPLIFTFFSVNPFCCR